LILGTNGSVLVDFMISGIVGKGLVGVCLYEVPWLLAQVIEPVAPEDSPVVDSTTATEAVSDVNPIMLFLSNPLNLLLLAAILFMFIVVRPQQRQAKELQKALAELKKNDRVVTSGGIHGVVVSSSDAVVTIRIDENSGARMTVNRESISKVVIPETKE
jgi:preprotein translocase subunit YajC